VNQINVLIEILEANVSVAEIQAQQTQDVANIEALIVSMDGDVYKNIKDSLVMFDAQSMMQAVNSLALDQVQDLNLLNKDFTKGD